MVSKVMQAVKSFFIDNLQPVHKFTAVKWSDSNKWEVQVEVVEEKEYMKAHAKDEMLGVYTVMLNEDLEICSFSRIELRSRGTIPKN
jgi:Gas vesicle synthesis protein GvpO.